MIKCPIDPFKYINVFGIVYTKNSTITFFNDMEPLVLLINSFGNRFSIGASVRFGLLSLE